MTRSRSGNERRDAVAARTIARIAFTLTAIALSSTALAQERRADVDSLLRPSASTLRSVLTTEGSPPARGTPVVPVGVLFPRTALRVVAVAAHAPPPAVRSAQTDPNMARARALFERGVSLADRLQWAEASEAFEQSYELVPRPGTLRNLGLSHRALGRYLQAIDELERFVRDGEPDADTRQQMDDAIREMRQQLATLTVTTVPSDATITIDNRPATANTATTIDPGSHVIAGRAPGHANGAQTVRVGRGESRTVELRLERSGQSVFTSPWFWIPVGLVVVGGLIVGGILIFSSERAPDCGSLGVCAMPQ